MADAPEVPLDINTRVEVRGNKGWVRFVGTTEFAPGKWIGVELDVAEGKNNGSVQGKVYFKCPENCGVFVRQAQVTVIPNESAATAPPAAAAPVALPATPAAPAPAAVAPAAVAPPPSAAAPAKSTPEPSAAATPAQAQGTDREVFLLREKVASLEAKRSEDRERIKDLEKFRVQFEQMVEYKTKWAQAQIDLQQQLKEAKREAKEALEAKEKLEAEVTELSESTELAMLDKEMAEEKVDSLQSEIQTLKDKVEELTLDLAILRDEKEEEKSAASAGGVSSAEMKQLEAHNERLKEALVRLRDLAASEKQELTAKVTALEKDAHAASDLREKNARLAAEVALLESQVLELKQEVDDAMGAAEMVEKLTNANLDLEEKVYSLNEMVNDLEALRDLSDELEESHVATERQLQGEIDTLSVKVHELNRAMELAQETIADQEQSLSKYQNLVRSLQSDLQELQRREASQREESRELASQSQSLLSLNLQLQSTAQKAHARAVDLELRKLDAQQSSELSDMFREFLPPAFFKTDYDALRTVLLFRRLAFKSHLALSHIRQQFHLDRELEFPTSLATPLPAPAAQSVVATLGRKDNVLFAHRLSAKLVDLSHVFGRFARALQSCEVELFLKLGFMFAEFAAHEKKLDAVIELVRRELINETVPLDGLDKTIAQLSQYATSYLPSSSSASSFQSGSAASASPLPTARAAAVGVAIAPSVHNLLQSLNDTDMLQWRCESIATECERAAFGVALVLSSLALAPASAERGELFESLSQLLLATRQSGDHARRIARKLPANSVAAKSEAGAADLRITLTYEHREKLAALSVHSSMLAKFAEDVCSSFLIHMDGQESLSTADVPQWLESFASLSAQYFATEGGATAFSQQIAQYLADFAAALQKGDLDETSAITGNPMGSNSTAPWIYRAQVLKEELEETASIRDKLAAKTEEVINALTALRLKEKELGDASVKSETLEKRIAQLKSECERLEDVRGQLDAASGQIKKLQETIDALNADNEVYEKEISDLQKQIRNLRKGGAIAGGAAGAGALGSGGANTGGTSTPSTNPNAMQVSLDSLGMGLPSVGPSPLGSPRSRSQHFDSSGGSGGMTPASVIVKYETQVEALEAAVRHLKLENSLLKGESMKSTLSALPSLQVLKTYADVQSAGGDGKDGKTLDKLGQAASDAGKLVKLIHDRSSTARIAKLQPLSSKEGSVRLADAAMSLASLQKLTSELCERAAAAIHAEVPGASVSTSMATFSSVTLAKQQTHPIGRLTLPESATGSANTFKVARPSITLTQQEFERLHSVFVA